MARSHFRRRESERDNQMGHILFHHSCQSRDPFKDTDDNLPEIIDWFLPSSHAQDFV